MKNLKHFYTFWEIFFFEMIPAIYFVRYTIRDFCNISYVSSFSSILSENRSFTGISISIWFCPPRGRSDEFTTRARLVAVAGPTSKAKAKRSEVKGGNLTADGWPWLYSTQPALGPEQRVNVERSLTPRLASLLYTRAPESIPRRPSLPSHPQTSSSRRWTPGRWARHAARNTSTLDARFDLRDSILCWFTLIFI